MLPLICTSSLVSAGTERNLFTALVSLYLDEDAAEVTFDLNLC